VTNSEDFGGDQAATPTPGPVNRSTFFAQQQRNRAATWRLSVVCVLTVLWTGVVLSLILAPPIYGIALVTLTIGKKYGSLPPEIWHYAQQLGTSLLTISQHFSDHPTALPPNDVLVYSALAVLLPGMAVQFVLWTGIRAMYLRAGAGGVLLTLGARPPRLMDLAEKKLVDVVEEIAIAGGVESPKVMLLDSDAGNAAAVGSSRHDATLIISRRLVDELNRDELQGVVAHLIGSTGNGDLRIAMTMVSVYQAFGLLDTLINAPFGPNARRALGRLLRMVFRRGGASDADDVSELLTSSLRSSDRDDLSRRMDSSQEKHGCLSILLLPIYFFNFSLKLTMWIFSLLFFEPATALLWRTRRYLADATAVQLTRNPDGLASALQRLSQCGGLIHGGKWASHLFIVGKQKSGGMPPEIAKRVQEIKQQTGAAPTRDQLMQIVFEAAMERRVVRASARDSSRPSLRAGDGDETLEQATGGMVPYHPPLEKRLKRLQAQGAHYAAGGTTRKTFQQKMVGLVLLLISLPFVLLLLGLFGLLVVLCIGLNLVFVMIAFTVILALVRLIP
jgi:Zn-dependent protease with chaperone function